MSRSLSELHELTDEQLVAEHDEQAKHTVVGTQYYVDELNRRSQALEAAAVRELAVASHALSVRTYWLSVTSTGLSVLALVVAVIALMFGR